VTAGTIDPTATPTVTPAVTNTPIATNTPAGGSTATSTPGGPTNTPTATNTPGGPTNTPTATNTPNPWSTGVRVDDSIETNSANGARISVDPSGNAYAVWTDNRNGNSDIYFSYRPSGGNWGANVRVDDASVTTPVYDTRIAVDSSGNAYAVWADDRNGGSYFDIYFSYRPSGGNWGTNVRINDVIGRHCGVEGGPDISVDSSGNAYVVSSTVDIYFSYRPSGGSWGTGERVSDLGDGWYPCVSEDSSGRVYAIWQESKNGNEHIYFSIRE